MPEHAPSGGDYLLPNADRHASGRFDALSRLFDGVTHRHLEFLGLDTGWRCWEVGAGGPSIPEWLANRVGATGYVLATDIDTSWLQVSASVDVRVHDVTAGDSPEGDFDLVHARLVLSHLPARDAALRHMVAALRPGGWLIVEDFDVEQGRAACPEPRSCEEHRANRIRERFVELLAARGVDLAYGRTLPRRLRSAGLESVGADAYTPLVHPAAADLERANVAQVAATLVRDGLLSEGDVEGHHAAVEARRIDVALPPLVSAWGRARR